MASYLSLDLTGMPHGGKHGVKVFLNKLFVARLSEDDSHALEEEAFVLRVVAVGLDQLLPVAHRISYFHQPVFVVDVIEAS